MLAASALWESAGLDASALERLQLSGDSPLLASSFHVGVAAQGTIACAALAATEVDRVRTTRAQTASVAMHDAERECTGYFALDGIVPEAWAPLSGLYPCRDGFVRIHANFDHHRDGALALLGIKRQPEGVTKQDVIDALAAWDAVTFESEAASHGLVVSAVRSFEAWDKTPQAAAIAGLPVFSIERIGDAPPNRPSTSSASQKPLAGIRVADLTRILAGPVCGRTLAAYGADVMLVNAPQLPNIDNIADTSRGKLSAHVDLTTKTGREALTTLVAGSQVFVEGYRPGGLAQLGFGPAALAAIRPGIVCVSLSAYGHEGPWANRRGFDSLVQTATGFNHAEAVAFGDNKPKAMPVQILDYASGFLMAFAAQAALLRQWQEGGSWHARVSLAQTAHWIRGLGRVDARRETQRLGLRSLAQDYPSGFGKLTALPHAALLSSSDTGWERRSEPPGTHPPGWPSAA